MLSVPEALNQAFINRKLSFYAMTNTLLYNALLFEKLKGNDVNTAVANVQPQFTDATADNWAYAIHLAWLATLSTNELKGGLVAAGIDTATAIAKAEEYILMIIFQVDTAGVLGEAFTSYPANVSQYVTMAKLVNTINEDGAPLAYQSGLELDTPLNSDDALKNRSIKWFGLGDFATPTNTVQLTGFSMGAENSDFDYTQFFPAPVPESFVGTLTFTGYSSYLASNPPAGSRFAFSFGFTINDDTSKPYCFDAWYANA